MVNEAFVEIPLERARQFRDLLTAARSWRGALIPATSTATLTPTKGLLEAISVFDQPPCDHPRSWRVFRSQLADADEVCGHCGASIVPGLTALAEPESHDAGFVGPVLVDPATSSPPGSSSPSP